MPLLSIIITTYQAEKTIERALFSVLGTGNDRRVEIIVVDDCSTDRTCELVRKMQKKYPVIRLHVMEKNTGSPSEPRNTGISLSSGKYVTFLDDDDEFVMTNLFDMLQTAEEKEADFVKGYLFCEEKGKRYEANRLPIEPTERTDTIQYLILYQSMTQDFIVSRRLLAEQGIRYQKDLRIGEDTVFILSILKAAVNPVYTDNWFLIYHKAAEQGSGPAATQKWGDKEVTDQVQAWKLAQDICRKMEMDYYSLRLPAALRNLLLMLVRYSDGISQDTYAVLQSFVSQTKKYTQDSMNLSKRYQQIYDSILAGDYEAFRKAVKRRLLIAGYDLKFILPAVPYLKEKYEIRIDEWTGHDAHNEKQSSECAAWADIIWCEWLLGNAVYYTQKKNKNQWLVIRAHRFERTREFGAQIDYEKVDAFFAVGYYYYEKFLSRFAILPEKARLLCNFVEAELYDTKKGKDFQYHIGLVGAIPKRKGLHKALELINRLKKRDERFKLYVMGKRWEELSWIRNNPEEAAYYRKCDNYIRVQGLTGNVIFGGYTLQQELYCDIGYVVSLSDSEEPESFHLAPAEGACAGCVGLILPWPGAEFIYPKEFICKDEADMADRIAELSGDPDAFRMQSETLRQYVVKRYGMQRFIRNVDQYLTQIRM